MSTKVSFDEIDYKGYTISIKQDPFAADPRNDWDPVSTMWCWHNRYELGDQDPDKPKQSEFEGWEQVKEHLYTLGAEVVLPLSLYDHGGVQLYVGSPTCTWDSGYVGFIFLTRDKISRYFGQVTPGPKLEQLLKEEVELYNHYLNGNVFEYEIEDPEGNSLSSCGGYYGYDHKESGLLEQAQYEIDRDIHDKEQEELLQLGKNVGAEL